jgi:Peptidase family S41
MSSRRRVLPFLLAAALSGTAVAADPHWREDYQRLKQAAEAGYANLAWFASPEGGVDLPRLDRRTSTALDEAETRDDARAAIRHFVEAIGDGHFAVLPQRDPPAPTVEPPGRPMAGLGASEACAALGYANRSQVAFSLPFESLAGFTLVDSGEGVQFRSGILRAGGRTIAIVRIRNFSPSQYPAACEAAWQAATPAQRADEDEFSERVEALWLRGLAATVARLAAMNPDAMLVDVGTNSGGDDSGDWAARLFTDRPLRSARMLMPAALALRYVDAESGALTRALANADPVSVRAGRETLAAFAARRRAAAGATCDMSWAWRERRPWRSGGCDGLADVGFASGLVDYQAPGTISDARVARQVYWPSRVDPWRGSWRGRTYVLTNSATYSSAEMFAAMLQNNRAARIVGSRTGGDGCGFAVETDPVTLPSLGMQIRMPNCVRLRANGADEVAGIVPDLPVSARQGQSARARAAEAAAAIATDLQAPARD